MSLNKNKLLQRSLIEMREARPFTKFTVAVGWGGLVGMFLISVCSVGSAISIGVAIAIAMTLGYLFRSA